jgi:hypothetical protein
MTNGRTRQYWPSVAKYREPDSRGGVLDAAWFESLRYRDSRIGRLGAARVKGGELDRLERAHDGGISRA